MRKIVSLLSKILAILFFIFMVIVDFFPKIGIDMGIPLIGLILFSALAVLARKRSVPVFKSNKQEFISYIFTGIVFFTLLTILTLIGGKSQNGIGLNDPIVWILYFVGAIYFYNKYKKVKA